MDLMKCDGDDEEKLEDNKEFVSVKDKAQVFMSIIGETAIVSDKLEEKIVDIKDKAVVKDNKEEKANDDKSTLKGTKRKNFVEENTQLNVIKKRPTTSKVETNKNLTRQLTTMTMKSMKSDAPRIHNNSATQVLQPKNKIHKLGTLPSYLKKKCPTELKLNKDETNKDTERPATFSEFSENNQQMEHEKTQTVDCQVLSPKMVRQASSSTLVSRASGFSTVSRSKMGCSKSFDPNLKPRFNNSGKHPRVNKEGTQDFTREFLKGYKLGKVPKYLRNRSNLNIDKKRRCNSPEISIGKRIDTIGDGSTVDQNLDLNENDEKMLENINEVSESSSKNKERKDRPYTVPENLKLLRQDSKTSVKSSNAVKNRNSSGLSKQLCSSKSVEENLQSRHVKCFKDKEASSPKSQRIHKLGYIPKYLKCSENESLEMSDESTLKVVNFSDPETDEKKTGIDDCKLNRDDTFILVEENLDKTPEMGSDNVTDVDNKNNVSHPAAVVDTSPKLDPCLSAPNEKDELLEKCTSVGCHIKMERRSAQVQEISPIIKTTVVEWKENYEDTLEQLRKERDTAKKQLKFERQRFSGRDKSYKEILERNKDILKQYEILKTQQKEKDIQTQQMKNQLRESRERNSKVIKEKNTRILDLENQISQMKEDCEVLKLYEPLKNENNKLQRELEEISKQFYETKTTLEQRITELTTTIDTAHAPHPIKSGTSNSITDKHINYENKHLKLMTNEYEKLCVENKRIAEQFEELRRKNVQLCQEMEIKNNQNHRLTRQLTKKNNDFNEMVKSCNESRLLMDRMKTEICVKLDEFRVYYTTLTFKEFEIDKLESRCIEALAYDDRVKSWLQMLDDQIHQLKQHKNKRTRK